VVIVGLLVLIVLMGICMMPRIQGDEAKERGRDAGVVFVGVHGIRGEGYEWLGQRR
jgi:hypothetical protein